MIILFEINYFRDVLLYDRIDEYDALPDKTFAGYQFFATECKNKEYVAFIDDDVFIKVHELKSHFKNISPESPEVRCLKGKCIAETGEVTTNKVYKENNYSL